MVWSAIHYLPRRKSALFLLLSAHPAPEAGTVASATASRRPRRNAWRTRGRPGGAEPRGSKGRGGARGAGARGREGREGEAGVSRRRGARGTGAPTRSLGIGPQARGTGPRRFLLLSEG